MASSTDVPAPNISSNRMPSLNQLAARININNPAPAAAANANLTAPRPRLAASILRTGSSVSVASTNDSTAVNAPSTRSTSPSALSASPPQSTTPSNDNAGGDPNLTSEKLEKLNMETLGPLPDTQLRKNVKVGYKNIPSLDAITQRLAKARQLSIDGTAKPPDAELVEDPKTPGVPMKAPEHPLQYPWTIYHDSKPKFPAPYPTVHPAPVSQPSSATDAAFNTHPPESTDYEAGLTVIGEFATVEEFCRYFNWLKPPSKLERNSNYHLFKSGIKPMWEDEANANGGKWVLTMRNTSAPGQAAGAGAADAGGTLLDRCWSWLAMALVGEELEDGDDICGAVVSVRSKVDRIQVWTRGKEDVERLNGIGRKLVKLLDVSEKDGIGLEFQYNTEDRPQPNKFLSIQSLPTTSYRSSFQPSASAPLSAGPYGGSQKTFVDGPASAGPGSFGSFGIGSGSAGAGGWKGKR